MDWIWDPLKAEINKRKHGVSFELAERALSDPFAVTVPDPYPDEERWRTLGMPAVGSAAVLFIVHTWPDGSEQPGRIIGARVASRAERKAYEEG